MRRFVYFIAWSTKWIGAAVLAFLLDPVRFGITAAMDNPTIGIGIRIGIFLLAFLVLGVPAAILKPKKATESGSK